MNLIQASILTAAFALSPPRPAQTSVQATIPPPPQATAPLTDEPITLPAIVYPDDAKRARIEGSVALEVTVDASGHVSQVRALDGPIPLRQAAVDAYTHATYKPIFDPKSGRPAPAIITTRVNFSLRELPPDTDLKVDQIFEPLHARCQDESRVKAPAALETCRQAVEISHRFSPAAQLEARATAVNDLVLVLLDQKDYVEASSVSDEAIALVQATNHPHTPAAATAYITRCEARSLAKQYSGAAEDCAVAEETLLTLIADQSAPDESKSDRTANYKIQLRETYELHAIILDKSHHPLDARHIRNRAKLV